MARKSVFGYKLKRGSKGKWHMTANNATYVISKGKTSGTWYVFHPSRNWDVVFNAGTLRDCVIWVCSSEMLVS